MKVSRVCRICAEIVTTETAKELNITPSFEHNIGIQKKIGCNIYTEYPVIDYREY